MTNPEENRTVSHYQIQEKLGGGGMGVVYKARDMKLDRLVALKFLPSHLSNAQQAKARFIQEARAASALDHPNICTIHEIGETDDGQLFIAMAYYEGESLKKKIDQGSLTHGEAVHYAIETAKGLKRAHEAGIIHRDIKPANIMVTGHGHVKIVDFGLAKVQNVNLTRTASTLGTIAYMSPEQAQGGTVDHRTDIWSLGVVLYEMLTGERPFKGEYEQAVIYDIVTTDPTPLNEIPDIPDGLAQVVDRMLQKDPESRYARARDLLSDLNNLETVSNVRRPHVNVFPSGANGRNRRAIVTSVAMIALAVIIVGLYLYIYPLSGVTFSERDWILITDFKNETGEEIFDHSLSTALAVSIGQSRFANVFPDRRIRQVLQRMKLENAEIIDEQLGSEIAQREGIPVILIPSISKVGDNYALTSILQDPETGEMLESEIVRAHGRDEVLDALDQMANGIRRDLGETVASISRQSRRLAEATTASLDALKQFALGIERQRNGQFTQARPYFEQALQLDSTFTSARASLGMLHLELSGMFEDFDAETGRKLLDKAVKNVESLTEVEKYGILAFHAQMVAGDLTQAAEYHETLLGLYPDYSHVHNNLGRVYMFMNRYPEAEREYKKAINLDPGLTLAYNNLNIHYLYNTGNVDSAYIWIKRQIADNPEYFYAYNLLGWSYVGLDSLNLAIDAFERTLELNPTFTLALYRLGHTYRVMGQFEEALKPIDRILEIDPSAYNAHEQLGLLYRQQGRETEARHHFDQFHSAAAHELENNPTDASLNLQVARALALLGLHTEARELERRALEEDSTLYFDHALLLSTLDQQKAALDMLERAIQEGFSNYIWIKVHPNLQPLYEEPRFQALIRENLKT